MCATMVCDHVFLRDIRFDLVKQHACGSNCQMVETSTIQPEKNYDMSGTIKDIRTMNFQFLFLPV